LIYELVIHYYSLIHMFQITNPPIIPLLISMEYQASLKRQALS